VLTRAELAMQNVEDAEGWARRAEEAAGSGELAAESAYARMATAAVALARAEPERAAQLALDGATRADLARAPIEAGRCRIVGARALVIDGHEERAVAELQRAVEGLRSIGANGYAAAAERELRRLGRRLPTASHRELASLTRSERAVVALVAEGLTNPEVAEQLYLSRHTVKRHLANAMGKLGVSSRRELRTLWPRTAED
jgi:DNA-binding CsgD family transcriptional regulator